MYTVPLTVCRLKQFIILTAIYVLLIGHDYVPLNLTEEFLPDNQDEMCFNLTVVEDVIVEENELFFVSLSSQDSAVRIPGDANQLNITLVDNDCKYKTFFLVTCLNK